MAVNNFPSTAGGGQPNMDYIKSVRMSSAAITWNRAGSAGTYAVFSSSASSGYAYFVGTSTTGVPLNKIVTVAHSFTSIQIVGIPNDILNLYKVSVDPNTSAYSDPSQAYYQWFDNSLVTSKIETFVGSGSYTLPVFAMPVADVQLVAGGAGGHGHGPGGGAGGLVTVTLFPIAAGTQYSIGTGSGGASNNWGGNSTFGTLTAFGGAPGHSDYNGRNGGSGSGAAKSGSGQSRGGGSATQTVPTGGRTNAGQGSNGGSVNNSSQHAGGGGGGAGSAGGNGHDSSAGAGGAGVMSIITGVIYSTGGYGSAHESNTRGSQPTGYGGPGSGGGSYPQGGSDPGRDGILVVRSYG